MARKKLICASWFSAMLIATAFTAGRSWSGEVNGKDEKDEKIAINDLPKSVSDSVLKAVPGGTILEAEKETEKGLVIYEVKAKSGEKVWEVKLDESGKVLKKEEDKEDDEDEDK